MIPVFWFRRWDSVVLLAVIDATIRSKLVKLRQEGKYQLTLTMIFGALGLYHPEILRGTKSLQMIAA